MRSVLLGWLSAGVVLVSGVNAQAYTVRTDRPRILFSAGPGGVGITVATFKQRCLSDPNYKRCKGGLGSGTSGSYPAISHAADYIVNGAASACAAAYSAAQKVAAAAPGSPSTHGFISNNQRSMLQLAVTLDWCDKALTAAQRTWLQSTIVTWADWYVSHDPGDVYHDDAPNVWSAVALAGLALAGTSQDAKAKTYLQKADAKWKQVLLPAMAHLGDWWHEGFTYVQPSLRTLGWYAAAWSTATDDDIYAWAKKNAKDLFEGYMAFHAYALRPDDRYVYFGDTNDTKQYVELFSRPLIDLLNYGLGSKLGQALSMEIRAASRPYYDYAGANGYLIALLYDAAADKTATARTTLPTARWLSKGAADVAILRSGWGKDDTFVWISCGDYFGAHQRMEAGSFQIFRKTMLSGSTGYYDSFDSDHWVNYYSQHSVHANTLAVYQPGELFPNSKTLGGAANVNDGGQRPLRRSVKGTGYPSTDLKTWLANKNAGPHYETGDLKTFAHDSCHDYVVCDVTAAYSSPGHLTNGNKAKVKEVTRQFVFLPPALLVIFDRVEATSASYDKRLLLHALALPKVSGSSFSVVNGAGTLFGQALLPVAAEIKTITGFKVEGQAHAPSVGGKESGGTRLQLSPAKEGLRDYFLTVLAAVPTAGGVAPVAKVDKQDAASVTATVTHGGKSYTLSFNKTAAAGGRMAITAGGGSKTCDQPLGGGGVPATDGGAGGDGPGPVGDSGASQGDSGASTADGGGGEGRGDDGCSCGLGRGSVESSAVLILLLGAVFLRRRGRRRIR